jgi:hypothetical protein
VSLDDSLEYPARTAAGSCTKANAIGRVKSKTPISDNRSGADWLEKRSDQINHRADETAAEAEKREPANGHEGADVKPRGYV